eukprot:scaffold3190_cov409-Prasinococcus_capsulatus_cf.AAC.7
MRNGARLESKVLPSKLCQESVCNSSQAEERHGNADSLKQHSCHPPSVPFSVRTSASHSPSSSSILHSRPTGLVL